MYCNYFDSNDDDLHALVWNIYKNSLNITEGMVMAALSSHESNVQKVYQ